MDWENLYRNLKYLNWVILLFLASVSFFLMENAFTTGIIIGGLIVIANFHVLQHTIRQGFFPDRSRNTKKASIIAKYYLRLAAMGILIYFFISQQWVNPVGLTIGLSIVVIGIVSLGIQMIRTTFSKEST
ncbi:MAG: ATP synthase subunit I [Desulfobacteraceae bacterium]|nr:MAG: ATP synthase subunit I [Desulfobacteraceae bacterium]